MKRVQARLLQYGWVKRFSNDSLNKHSLTNKKIGGINYVTSNV